LTTAAAVAAAVGYLYARRTHQLAKN
jgi:hypothetical protein